ncbi:MAG: hypothetical protein HXX15_18550 [Rhodopseudomonas sp.]|nr:hypothetical protein [Rhodopseudomonas sp.]
MQKYVKYISKFISDILPSVVATIIGAYIVNHYIAAKPDAPAASAVVAKATDDAAGKGLRIEAKPGVAPAGTASAPDPVKGKGAIEKSVAEKPSGEKPTEKAADKLTGTHQTTIRDRAVAKAAAPAAASPATTGSVPSAAPAEPATQEERRDANELARAAIERLRPPTAAARPAEASPRMQEAARMQEPPHAVVPLQPLPPPVDVTMPAPASASTFIPGVNAALPPTASPPYTYSASANGRDDDPRRPSPPAEIPPPAFVLQADAVPPARRTVAEDVLLAAKSVFHAVLPR